MNKYRRFVPLLMLSAVVAGCGSFYNTAFRTEQTLVSAGHSAVHTYNVYHHSLTNGMTDPVKLAEEEAKYQRVLDEARTFGACAQVYDSALESYRVNSADTNKAAVTIAFDVFSDETTNIVNLVKFFINPKNPNVVTFSPLPQPITPASVVKPNP